MCIAVNAKAGYVNLWMFFRCLHNLFIQNLCEVISGNNINAIARNHDQIIVLIFRTAGFENISRIAKSINRKYQIPCVKANIQQMIQSHCLTDTIFFSIFLIGVFDKISDNGLENTIINNEIRAIFQNKEYNPGNRNIINDSIDK